MAPLRSLASLLKDCAEVFVDGDWVESKDQDPDGDVRLVQLADVGDGYYIDKSKRFLTSETAKRLKCTYLKDGDVLVARMPDPIGRACIFPGDSKPAVTVVDVCIIRVKETCTYARWLMHALNSPLVRSQIAGLATGTTRSRVSRGNLGKIEIPVTALGEQRRIAAILDKVDSLRTKRREALAQLDRLAQACFCEMFGDVATNPKEWPVEQLGSCCKVGSSKRVFVEELVDEGVPFYRGTEIGQLGAGEEVAPTLFISQQHYAQLKAEGGVPSKGDLLLPSICPDGRIYTVDTDAPFYYKDARVLWIGVDQSRLSSAFLRHYLKLLFARSYSKIASGTTFAELKIFALKQLEVFLPPMDLQQRFAKVVRSIELQQERAKASHKQVERLFEALQHRAFRRELRE